MREKPAQGIPTFLIVSGQLHGSSRRTRSGERGTRRALVPPRRSRVSPAFDVPPGA